LDERLDDEEDDFPELERPEEVRPDELDLLWPDDLEIFPPPLFLVPLLFDPDDLRLLPDFLIVLPVDSFELPLLPDDLPILESLPDFFDPPLRRISGVDFLEVPWLRFTALSDFFDPVDCRFQVSSIRFV